MLIGEEVHYRLSDQLDVVLRSDRQLPLQAEARGLTDQAVRRLEAGLHVFAPIYGAGTAARLRTELGWFGALVTEVSDREELGARVRSQLGRVAGEAALRAMHDHIYEAVARETAPPLARLEEGLHSERYQQLVVLLQSWSGAPELTRRAQLPVTAVDKYLLKGAGAFDHRLAHALVTGDQEDLRLAAIAGQHVVHAVGLSGGKRGRKAAKSVRRVARLEALLVEFAASVRTAEFLQRLGPAAGAEAQQHSFTLGRLHEQEQRRARVLLGQLKEDHG